MYEKPRVNARSTFTFTSDLPYIVSNLFTHVKPVKVYVRTHVKIMRQWKSTFRVKYQHYNYRLPFSAPVLPKKHKNAIKIKPNSNKCFMEYLRVRANIIDLCLRGTTVRLTGTLRLLWWCRLDFSCSLESSQWVSSPRTTFGGEAKALQSLNSSW